MTEKLKKAAVWILLTAGALVMMFPFIWMLATSLKTLPEATAIPPTLFPAKAIFANYAEAFTLDSRKRDEDTTSRIAANP